MSRARENADGARLDAPLASPAFTGTPTGITAAHLEAGVLPSYVTGGSGLTALGTVTSGTIGGAVTFENGKTLRNIEEDYLTSNISKSGTGSGGATTEFTVFTPTYTPKFIGSQVTGTFYAMMETDNIGGSDGRGYCKLEFTGSGITNWTSSTSSNYGEFDRGGSGIQGRGNVVFFAPLHTTTSTDEITCTIKAKSSAGSGTPVIQFIGGGSPYLYSKFQWMEFK